MRRPRRKCWRQETVNHCCQNSHNPPPPHLSDCCVFSVTLTTIQYLNFYCSRSIQANSGQSHAREEWPSDWAFRPFRISSGWSQQVLPAHVTILPSGQAYFIEFYNLIRGGKCYKHSLSSGEVPSYTRGLKF